MKLQKEFPLPKSSQVVVNPYRLSVMPVSKRLFAFQRVARPVWGFVLCGLAHAPWGCAGHPNPMPPTVNLKIHPFAPADVRLLESPFQAARDRDAAYVLTLDPDRLLAKFRELAGLKSKAPAYGGWESTGLDGHTLGHYLSACSRLFASLGDTRFRERVDYVVAELALCQNAHGDGYVAAIPNGRKVFEAVAAGDIRAKKFNLNGAWSPFYTLHKLFAGLRDAHHLCANTNALAVEFKLADWVENILAGLSEAQMQEVLACEFGGMNEVLADLYADTGDARYLRLSRRFNHQAVFGSLARGEDCLPGLHANTQIPKFIGLARRYQLSGDRTDRQLAEFFWERVVGQHSYVTGGNSESEYFGPPGRLNDRLSTRTTETCNTYNLLKLTRLLFLGDPQARYADYYERALYNHILASQDPVGGMVTYFVPLRGGFRKEYSTPFNTFTCCHGTGLENHVQYGESIYFHGDDALYVNLFIASELGWQCKGVVLRQETRFPYSDGIELILRCAQPTRFALRLRHPAWAQRRLEVTINGQAHQARSKPGSSLQIRRTWADGDRVQVRLPMALRVEAMPDNPKRIALFYGPLLLAGDLGPTHDAAAPNFDYAPVLIPGDRPLADWIQPVPGQSGTFRTMNVGQPRDVTLLPFHRLHHRRYAVYWDVCTPQEWAARQTAAQAAAGRQRQLDADTVDRVLPGNVESERAHHLQGEGLESEDYNGRRYRLTRGKWFSYDLAVMPNQPMSLVCAYWGGERPGSRLFDLLVDGQWLSTQNLANNQPDQFFDVIYPIPFPLTQGKAKVTVKFAAHEDKMAGGIFDLRTVKAAANTP